MKKMKYIGRWHNYDRHNSPPDTILKLTATLDREALEKVFLKKVFPDYDLNLEDFLKENKQKSLTLKFLKELFNGIDVGGWDFLEELRNLTTGKVVFSMGLDEGEEEDLD